MGGTTYSGKKYQIDYGKFSDRDHPALDPTINPLPSQPVMTARQLANAEESRKRRLERLFPSPIKKR